MGRTASDAYARPRSPSRSRSATPRHPPAARRPRSRPRAPAPGPQSPARGPRRVASPRAAAHKGLSLFAACASRAAADVDHARRAGGVALLAGRTGLGYGAHRGGQLGADGRVGASRATEPVREQQERQLRPRRRERRALCQAPPQASAALLHVRRRGSFERPARRAGGTPRRPRRAAGSRGRAAARAAAAAAAPRRDS